MRKRDKHHARKDPRYKTIKHTVQKKLRSAYWQYVEDIISPKSDDNSLGAKKRFRGLFKHLKTEIKGVPPLKHQSNLISNAAGKAAVLNSYFQSVFTSHEPLDLKQLCQKQCDRNLEYPPNRDPFRPPISITTTGIAKLLNNLNTHKAAWPDGISLMVLKELSSVTAPVLQIIFCRSLTTHQVPDDWRKALVTPIFKKGDKDCVASSRPISLTCICSKLLERIITKNIITHLEHHNLLFPLQHGFRELRSCESQLIEFVNEIIGNPRAKQTDIIITDFLKVVDKVPHNRPLFKFESYVIRDDVLLWIRAFLENRQQRVVVDSERTDFAAVLSSVPQGSMIGPVLFVAYINDLPGNIRSKVRLFAVNTIIYMTIASEENCIQLQEDLDAMQK